MKRLTEQDEWGNWGLKGVMWEELCPGCQISNEVCRSIYGALCKLKDYENTGLDPDEVERINDFDRSQCGKMLKKLKEEQRKYRWIPVTEWIPEMDRNVLVTVNGSYNRISYCNAIEIGRIRWGGKWEIEGLQEWDDPEVTAWMLLPEPYREDGE